MKTKFTIFIIAILTLAVFRSMISNPIRDDDSIIDIESDNTAISYKAEDISRLRVF